MSGTSTPDPISAAAVLKLFEEHWKSLKPPPDQIWCDHIAHALRAIRDRRPPSWPVPAKALKYGRLFVNHVEEMKEQLTRESGIYFYTRIHDDGTEEDLFHDRRRYDLCVAALAAAEEASRAVEMALDAWKVRDPLIIKDQDPAKYLSSVVKMALLAAGHDTSIGSGGDSPLCEFIAGALPLANVRVGQGPTKGQAYGAEAVSAVLSGRTKRLNYDTI